MGVNQSWQINKRFVVEPMSAALDKFHADKRRAKEMRDLLIQVRTKVNFTGDDRALVIRALEMFAMQDENKQNMLRVGL